jgi:hypothetical protein
VCREGRDVVQEEVPSIRRELTLVHSLARERDMSVGNGIRDRAKMEMLLCLHIVETRVVTKNLHLASRRSTIKFGEVRAEEGVDVEKLILGNTKTGVTQAQTVSSMHLPLVDESRRGQSARGAVSRQSVQRVHAKMKSENHWVIEDTTTALMFTVVLVVVVHVRGVEPCDVDGETSMGVEHVTFEHTRPCSVGENNDVAVLMPFRRQTTDEVVRLGQTGWHGDLDIVCSRKGEGRDDMP